MRGVRVSYLVSFDLRGGKDKLGRHLDFDEHRRWDLLSVIVDRLDALCLWWSCGLALARQLPYSLLFITRTASVYFLTHRALAAHA